MILLRKVLLLENFPHGGWLCNTLHEDMKNECAIWISLWVPVIAWCGFIYFLSSIPHLSSGLEYDFFLRKMAHVVEYAVLVGLVWRALGGSTQWSVNRICVITLVFCAFYAASDEWHQSFIDSRSPALRDVMIDILGACAMGVFLWRMRFTRRH